MLHSQWSKCTGQLEGSLAGNWIWSFLTCYIQTPNTALDRNCQVDKNAVYLRHNKPGRVSSAEKFKFPDSRLFFSDYKVRKFKAVSNIWATYIDLQLWIYRSQRKSFQTRTQKGQKLVLRKPMANIPLTSPETRLALCFAAPCFRKIKKGLVRSYCSLRFSACISLPALNAGTFSGQWRACPWRPGLHSAQAPTLSSISDRALLTSLLLSQYCPALLEPLQVTYRKPGCMVGTQFLCRLLHAAELQLLAGWMERCPILNTCIYQRVPPFPKGVFAQRQTCFTYYTESWEKSLCLKLSNSTQ